MKKKNHSKRIAVVLTIAFAFIANMSTIFWALYNYWHIEKNLYSEQRKTTEYLLNGIDKNLDIYFGEIQKLTDNLFGADIVQELLTRLRSAERKELTIREVQEMNAFFNGLVGGHADIVKATLYSDKQEVYTYSINSLNELYPSWDQVLPVLREGQGRFQICGSRYQKYKNGNRYGVITVGRQIRNLDTGESIGYLLMDIDYVSFAKLVGINSKNEDVLFIHDKEGKVIFSSASNKDVMEKYFLVQSYMEAIERNTNEFEFESNYFEWSYRMLRSNQTVINSLREGKLQLLLICAVTTLTIFAASLVISYSITRPIHRLESAMMEAESENYSNELRVHTRYRELDYLLESYNKMIAEIKELLLRQEELFRKQAKAEYQALQLQITPHFLYNSLDSINCLAHVKNEPEISRMICGLARIFQYNMKFDSGKVTLQDEVAHVKNYCMLQAINYQDRFSIGYDISEDLMKCNVIKFMLQPLVENAILHGMKEVEADGKIEIRAVREGGFVKITVEDNGCGMTEEEEKHLGKLLNTQPEECDTNTASASHIGLSNVSRRLKYYYGDTAEMFFETVKGQGTAVHIRVPLTML